LTTLVVSCGEENKTKNNAGVSTYLTAKINGKVFKSSVEIVAFKAPTAQGNHATYITTADLKGDPEYEFIMLNDVYKKDNPDVKWREGNIELKNATGKTVNWKIPRDFNFKITKETGITLEGTFSFIATPVYGNELEALTITDGKYKANKKSY